MVAGRRKRGFDLASVLAWVIVASELP